MVAQPKNLHSVQTRITSVSQVEFLGGEDFSTGLMTRVGLFSFFFKIYEVKRFTWNGDGSNSETMRSFVSLAIFLRKTCELMDTAGLWSCMHLSVNGRTESETNQICIYCCCRWISAFVSSIANSTRKSSFSEGGLAQSEVEWLFWAHLAQLLLDAQLRSLVYRT